MWSVGAGGDVMKRIAAPMIGGILTSFLMELIVYPPIFAFWKWNFEATDGSLYGTTVYGGTNSHGRIFKISPSGKFAVVYSFCSQLYCADGSAPSGTLVQAADGSFYGVTGRGGAIGFGTVFAKTAEGVISNLHSFDISDGAFPVGLVQGNDGDFYGTTGQGAEYNDGSIFQITAQGNLTILHVFNGNDGRYPYGLVQATDGSFYGATNEGGARNW